MEYTGGRTENDIVNWVLKKVGPPSVEVTCDQLKEKVAKDKLALAYFGDLTIKEYKETFLETAKSPMINEKFNFYHLNDKDCAASFGATQSPALVLFRQFDEPTVVYKGNWESTPIVDFMLAEMTPILMEFSEEYIEPIFGQRKPASFLFKAKSDTDKPFFKNYEEAAKKLKGEILFIHSGATEGIQQRLGEFIGVEEKDLPTLRLLDPADNMKKYAFQGKVQDLTLD